MKYTKHVNSFIVYPGKSCLVQYATSMELLTPSLQTCPRSPLHVFHDQSVVKMTATKSILQDALAEAAKQNFDVKVITFDGQFASSAPNAREFQKRILAL